MTKKIIILIFLLSIIFFLAILRFTKIQPKKSQSQLEVGKCKFNVDLATTEQQKEQGLSGREKMDKLTGMLFIFTTAQPYHFWMKDMNFPLDFVWIKGNKIIDLSYNIPPPKNNQNIARVFPKESVDKVLEINNGLINECKIEIGNEVKFYPAN